MAELKPHEAASCLVDPVSSMLRALVELNWHAEVVRDLGWAVEFSIDAEGPVAVSVSRAAGSAWPRRRADPS